MEPKLKLASSVIELSEKALQINLDFLKKRAGDGVILSSVIKGNAYGHGIETFLPLAESCGVRHFSVFSAAEAERALKVRGSGRSQGSRSISGRRPGGAAEPERPDSDEELRAGNQKAGSADPDQKASHLESQIMIMGMIDDEAIRWAIENDISFYIFDRGRLESTLKAARAAEKQARIHLQIETGMNREGVEPDQFDWFIDRLKQHKEFVKLEGICTHFAGAESVSNWLRIDHQKKRFREAVDRFQSSFDHIPKIHAASSAALLAYPESIYNMVRIGIAQYGFWPSREIYMLIQKERQAAGEDPLKRVIRWSSKVMSVKKVSAGDFVGYGNMHLASRDERIATVPIGYSHGFGRNLTNTGYVLIRGKRAPVAGLVNMNMLTVDVTDIPDVSRGDEVVIIGRQGDNEISVASFGEMSNNLNYEVLTRLPDFMPRLVVRNGY